MAVPVMQVGKMGMTVDHWCVPVPMAVRFTWRDAGRMFMLMMAVMDMAVFVLECFVLVVMAVRFSQMQPQPNCHQNAGDDERRGDGLPEHHHRQHSANERSGREIGT